VRPQVEELIDGVRQSYSVVIVAFDATGRTGQPKTAFFHLGSLGGTTV
jgi:ABC-type phosphate transport system ATPase subunit